jgi:isocitrate lyase
MGNTLEKKKQMFFDRATVQKLQGTFVADHNYSKQTSKKLKSLLATPQVPVRALGAFNGQQAVQYIKSGLQAIYVSGWQVAACANTSGETYPDQSLYPVDSVPKTVYSIVQALLRADKVQHSEKGWTTDCFSYPSTDYIAPLIADGEAGFGGPLNAFELTRKMVEAGAAGIHFEDQLASEKKCGHLGGKVLVPVSHFVRTLKAARLAAEVENCPDLVLIARTDAESAQWVSSDVDTEDKFVMRHQPRSPEGFYRYQNGLEACIARALVYAEIADLVWFETSSPDLGVARTFANAIHEKFPGYPLAYNCSPSFCWHSHLSEQEMRDFQQELGTMGYVFQFVTLAAFHATNLACFDLAFDYAEKGMLGYSEMQQREFSRAEKGYTAVRHQHEVGTSYFDAVAEALGSVSTRAMKDSTEASQFFEI